MRKEFMEKVLAIQTELKAPKDKFNKFGNYAYRSCEGILEALKPLLAKHKLLLTVSDELVCIGDRFYVKATATLYDTECDFKLSNSAFAREEETKKGMDGSQITGTASSYARKYALNGLFCIDDTKDADTDEYAQQTTKDQQKEQPKQEKVDYRKQLIAKLNEKGIDATEFAIKHGVTNKTTQEGFKKLLDMLG